MRNAAPTLLRALDSLAAQTEQRWELVAINDGSTDESAAQLDDAARKDPRIRVIHTGPDGIVSALNRGLAAARTPLVARHDADDFAHRERLLRQCEYLDRHPDVGLVSCLVDFGEGAERGGGYRRHVDWLNQCRSPDAIRRGRFVEAPFAHPSVVFRRALVEQHGGYQEGDFPEDYDLWLRWLEAGVKMAKVEETLLHWVDSPARLSRISPRYAVPAFYRLKARYLARWLAQTIPRDRPLWIWGAGRVTRTRVQWLLDEGIQPAGWIDIDPRKIGRVHAGRPVCAPGAMPPNPRPFVLAYVGSWDARSIIGDWLERHGYREEADYLHCA